MSYDKPSSSGHWQSSLNRSSDKQNKRDSSSAAHNVWNQVPRVSGSYSSLKPLATTPSAGTIDAETRRHPSHGDGEAYNSPSSTNFPPLSAISSTRLNSSRRPTPPTPSQTRSPIYNIQAGATQNASTFSNRSITSPRSRTISPQQSAGSA